MTKSACFFALALLASGPVAAASVGQPAPEFTGTSTDGRPVKLSEFKGNYVVLEWTNPGCPYVMKHYGSGNMAALQKELGEQGVVWLTINSTSKSHRDYQEPAALAAWLKQNGAAPRAALMDPSGAIGRLYAARTTPHMYVIDPGGKLIYAGAIDDKRGTDPAEVKMATNFVKLALSEAMTNKTLSRATTNPYGCSVKY